jgi:hypothetical protein
MSMQKGKRAAPDAFTGTLVAQTPTFVEAYSLCSTLERKYEVCTYNRNRQTSQKLSVPATAFYSFMIKKQIG